MRITLKIIKNATEEINLSHAAGDESRQQVEETNVGTGHCAEVSSSGTVFGFQCEEEGGGGGGGGGGGEKQKKHACM